MVGTKAAVSKPVASVAPTKFYCGVSFEMAGKEVKLDPSTAISEVKTQGLECTLPSRLALGIVSGIFDDVTKALDVEYTWDDLKGNLEGVPVLEGAVTLLGNANLALEQFHIKLPPTHTPAITEGGELVPILKEKQAPKYFTVAMSMIWEGDSGAIFGNLKLKGVFFKISNE
jgi:hypothetical protein